MPDRSAETAIAFLKSPMGIRQTFHMGRDEMQQVTADRWDAEVWGSAIPSPNGLLPTKLFFYFGEDDHWVARRTRDDIIFPKRTQRSQHGSLKPLMEVDDQGIPHCFPIRYSAPVAHKCVEYLKEIFSADRHVPEGGD